MEAISKVEDDEQPTIKLTRALSERLHGIVDEPLGKIEWRLDVRRRKWRKRSKRNKLLGPTPPILYKPVDEAFLREKEDALYEFEDKVEELTKMRRSCCIAARQIEQEKLQHQLEILQSRQHTLTTTDFEADRTVDVATSSHRETQELLQSLSSNISDVKSLQQVKRMKFKTMPQRPPLHSISQPRLATGDSSHPNTSTRTKNQQDEVSNIFSTLSDSDLQQHAHYLYSDPESIH